MSTNSKVCLTVDSQIDTTLTVSTFGTIAGFHETFDSWKLIWGDGIVMTGRGRPPATMSHIYAVGGSFDVELSAQMKHLVINYNDHFGLVATDTLDAAILTAIRVTLTAPFLPAPFLPVKQQPPPQPLAIVCPTIAPMTSSSAVSVSYVATTSGGRLPVSIQYTPPSGSVFQVGTTTVTAVATDASPTPQMAICTFPVTISAPAAVTNYALAANGGSASASSSYDVNYLPSGTINGDRKGLNWGANGGWSDVTSGVYPDWLQVDFNGSKTVAEIDVFTLQDNYAAPVDPTSSMIFTLYGITDFLIQTWDGAAWNTVPGGAIVANNLVWVKVTFAGITTTKIRVLVSASLGGYSRIVELEAYGPGGGSGLPATVTGLVATPGNAQVALGWTAVTGGQSYKIKRSTTTGAEVTLASGVITTTYTDATAVNGQIYFYVVSAVNSAGEGPNSAEVSATPAVQTAPPIPPGALSSTDFTYLGRVGVPILPEWSFSRGALAGRIVGGVQHLFIAGAESNVERLFEVTVPTPYLGVGQIPPVNRVTVIQAWGDVSNGNLLTEAPSVNKQYIRGLKWLEDRQRLVWDYTVWYGTESSPGNPAIGLSRLNADGTVTPFGPWRGSLPFIRCCGSIVDVPAWFQAAHNVGRLATSAAQFSQVAFLGANMQAFDPPADATPRDTPVDWSPAEQNTHVTIPFKTLIYHDMDHPQSKPLDPGGWAACSGGATLAADVATPLPAVFGGRPQDHGGNLDWWDTAVWIETATKKGILYFGQQVRSGHNWYGNYPRTAPGQPLSGTCWHGLTAIAVGGGIGPSATSCYVVGALYDPIDFGRVADGVATPDSLTPYQQFTADQFANNSGFVNKNGTVTFQFGGAHYEPSTKLLYLVENQVEYLDYKFLSVVHVFRVN